MRLRAIKKEDFSLVLSLDRKVYPTSKPVTEQVLGIWYSNNPEFGMVYEEKGLIAAVCVAIPLTQRGWELLISGKLSESELSRKQIFDKKRDEALGIHVYHIETINKTKNFYEKSLKDLGSMCKSHKIFGISALAVTEAGKNLCKKLGFLESGYKSKEYVLSKDGKMEVAELDDSRLRKKREQGFDAMRCEMLLSRYSDNAQVWKYLGRVK